MHSNLLFRWPLVHISNSPYSLRWKVGEFCHYLLANGCFEDSAIITSDWYRYRPRSDVHSFNDAIALRASLWASVPTSVRSQYNRFTACQRLANPCHDFKHRSKLALLDVRVNKTSLRSVNFLFETTFIVYAWKYQFVNFLSVSVPKN